MSPEYPDTWENDEPLQDVALSELLDEYDPEPELDMFEEM